MEEAIKDEVEYTIYEVQKVLNLKIERKIEIEPACRQAGWNNKIYSNVFKKNGANFISITQ